MIYIKRLLAITFRSILITLLALAMLAGALRLGGQITGLKHHPAQKSADKTVLCAGDSFVYGVGGEAFPQQLEKILNEWSDGTKFSVYNVGRPGNGTSQVLAGLQRQLDEYKPDFLIVLAGTNDNWRRILPLRKGPSGLLTQLRIWNFFRLLRRSDTAGPAAQLPSRELVPAVSEIQRGERAWNAKNMEDVATIAYESPEASGETRLYALRAAEQFLAASKCMANNDTAGAARIFEQLPSLSAGRRNLLSARLRKAVRFRAAVELGHLYSQLDSSKAINAFRQAVEMRPDYIYGYYHMATLYHRSNDSANFLKYTALLLKKAPDFTPAYMELCWHHYLRREQDAALDYFAKALALEPKNPELLDEAPFSYAELAQCLPGLEQRYPELRENPAYLKYKKLAKDTDGAILKDEKKTTAELTENNILAIGELAKNHGTKLILASYPERSLPAVEAAARALGAQYINFVPLFQTRFRDRREFLAYDSEHCNSAGYRFMAERFAALMLEQNANQAR